MTVTEKTWTWEEIESHQARVFSQNGEDGVLLYLCKLLGLRTGRCFEVGAGMPNGQLECNTAILLNNGWKGVVVDQDELVNPLCKQMRVDRSNICGVIERYNQGVTGPDVLDVISVDVDGMDYWLMKVILQQYKPDIYIAEYNAHKDPAVPVSVPYDKDFKWDGSDYFGASAAAMVNLAHEHKYRLVATVNRLNMFFVAAHRIYRTDLHTEPPLSMLGLPTNRHPTDRSRIWTPV